MFKSGEVVVCINITNKPFKWVKREDVKLLTKGKIYTVLKSHNSYNPMVADRFMFQETHKSRRFRNLNRKEKLNQLIKIIHDKLE